MNKQDIARDMRECLGVTGLISKNQLSKYLKMDRRTKDNKDENETDIMSYLEGLRFIPSGRGPKYFVVDVAGRILDMSVKQ